MVSIEPFKIVTLGEVGVGKSSIIYRFTSNAFSSKRTVTEDINSVNKKIFVDSQDITLNIWDTAGQEKFRVVAPNYYRGAVGALLVYDITDRHSFEEVVRWVNELYMQGEENIQIVIVGNKCDLESDRQIESERPLEYAKSINAPHLHISAKTGDNVEYAFTKLTKMIINVKKGKEGRVNTTRKKRGVSVDRRVSIVGPTKSKCC